MWDLQGHYPDLDIGMTMALSSKLHPLPLCRPYPPQRDLSICL